MDSNFTVGDRVSHPDYAGIGIVDEVLDDGVSVFWCELSDIEHYDECDCPLFTSGLQLVEKSGISLWEVAA